MSQRLLITGISGFIGRNVVRELLLKKIKITAIIRPQTAKQRYAEFSNEIEFVEIDLADMAELRKYLKGNSFDHIFHIAALRPKRDFSEKEYYNVNVNATEQLMISAGENNSQFVFCSSVGVFGTNPHELPAKENTERVGDNLYHQTKIDAEALIMKNVLYGLKAAILRPSITYGKGDFGFPYILTKLTDKKLLFLPRNNVFIHLTNISVLAKAFARFIEQDFTSGKTFIIADSKPVKISDLVDFIKKELSGTSYPANRSIDSRYFKWGSQISEKLGSENWKTKFDLISKSWFYEVKNSYEELSLKPSSTIPSFRVVTDWYKEMKK